MASNNNRPGGGKRSNSPRYSDRYGPGHMNPYLGGQPGQSPFIRQMEERQEAARQQNEQEAARRQREQEALRQREQQEAARRAAEEEREQHSAQQAAETAQSDERRRQVEETSGPRAMRDPDMQQRLRQIQEQATREAKGFVRGDEADFGDLDFVQPSADVRLRLDENDQPMVALESVDSEGRTVVSWVPVMLTEKEMESFFPAITPVQDNKGIHVQEDNRNPGGAENDLPEDDRSADDLVLIPIAGTDNNDDKSGTGAAAAAELLDSDPDVPETNGAPAHAGAGLEAMLSNLPSIELEPEPEPEDTGDGVLLAAAGTAAALLTDDGRSASSVEKVGDDIGNTFPAVAAMELPTIEYNVPDDDTDDKSVDEDTDDADDTGEDDEDAPAAAVTEAPAEEEPASAPDTEEDEADQTFDESEDSSDEGAAEEPGSDEDTDEDPENEDTGSEDSAADASAEPDAAEPGVFSDDEPADFDEDEPSEAPADTAVNTPEDEADADDEAPAAPVSPVVIASEADEAGYGAEDASHESAARPKHKRRRSRPTDVAMPEELAAAAVQETEVAEPEHEPEPAAPRRTAVAVSPAFNSAAGHSLLGDPEDYGDQDSTLFTRKARPEATALFVMPEGSKLPRYIDDDDFVERWLGEEEDEEDLAAQSKSKRRKISAFVGAATLVLALIGLIAVAKWGIGLLGNLGGSESQKEIYGDFVSPVVMSEVPVFETWDAVPQDKLLQSAVFSVLMDNDVTYERDDTGKFIIPSSDVVNAVKELYGAFSTDPAEDENINAQIRVALYGSAGEDVTNEDAYYVDTEDSFHVADGLSGPAPNVTDISRRDNTVTLTVEYLEDLEVGSGGILYTREIILTLKDDGTYFVKAVREAQE